MSQPPHDPRRRNRDELSFEPVNPIKAGAVFIFLVGAAIGCGVVSMVLAIFK
jgi:hypothetical protein